MSTYLGALFCERKVTSAKKKITPTDRREQLVSLFDQDFCFWESYLFHTGACPKNVTQCEIIALSTLYCEATNYFFVGPS